MTTNNKQCIPRLRFKGFHEEWEEKKLSDLSSKVNKKNKDNSISNVLTDSAESGVVDQQSFFDKDIANSKNTSGYYVVDSNDYIYNPRISKFAPYGPIRRNKLGIKGIVSPLYYVFNVSNVNFSLLDNYFLSSKWHKYIYQNGNSGARSDRIAIKDTVFQNMPIYIPNTIEQQKIGAFFSKLDQLIDLQAHKIDQLQRLKRGYLQKLFPQLGESVPRLRFNGFRGEWKSNNLLDIVELKTGNKNAEDDNPTGNYVLFDRSSEIKHLDSYDYDEQVIVYPGEGATFNPRYFDGKYSLHQRAYGLYNFKNIYYGYLYEFLTTQSNIFVRFSVGSTAKSLRKETFSHITVPRTNEKEERMIGSFLLNMDKNIELQNQKLDDLKNLKKAYLQKMFM
jgi:type I restriction enzyme, S subunit